MPSVLTVSPLADANNYDIITIAGITTSTETNGLVVVTNAVRKFTWDAKKGAGSQGTTVTYRGWDLAKPKLVFKFWRDEQIRAFYDTLVPVMYYDAEKEAPKPWDVYHPKCFANQIYWLLTDEIGDLTDEGNQLWTITVETTEYRQAKAKNATSTPEQSNSNQNGKATKPTVESEQDAEIRRLTRQFLSPL